MSIESLLDRPIAFQRVFVSLGAGVTGALLLSQAVYWSRRSTLRGGWFYKTREEWEEETGLTRREQEGARKKLRDLGVLEEKKQGIPCKTYYRINTDRLQTCLHKTAQLDGTKPSNWVEQNRPPITEITTETTTDTVNTMAADAPRVPYQDFVSLYHECLPELPRVQLLTEKRKKAIKARWNTSEKTKSLDWWREYFLVCKSNPFLMGNNDRNWRADFDFLITESKFAKIVEGGYQGGRP